jgi:hypothetical protein
MGLREPSASKQMPTPIASPVSTGSRVTAVSSTCFLNTRGDRSIYGLMAQECPFLESMNKTLKLVSRLRKGQT